MLDPALAALDLEAWGAVLRPFARASVALSVRTESGRMVAGTVPSQQGRHVEMRNLALDRAVLTRESSGGLLTIRTELDLRSADDEPLWLVLELNASEDEPERLEIVARGLVAMAGLIKDAKDRQDTLEGMSRELAIRYEELNLVYDLEARRDVHEDTNLETLYEYPQTIRDYLEFDCVVLQLDGGPSYEAGEDGFAKVPEPLIDAIHQHLEHEPETLVVNRDAVIDWLDEGFPTDLRFIAVPLRLETGHGLGTLLCFNAPERRHFTNSDRRMCEVVAAEIVKTLKRYRDRLTGLLNREGFERALGDRLASDDAVPPAVVLLNIDRFQMLNDRYGVDRADAILVQVAQAVGDVDAASIRSLARLNGDQFAMIVEAADLPALESCAASIVAAVRNSRYRVGTSIATGTASLGAVLADDVACETSHLINAAETALDEAKRSGGNRALAMRFGDERIGAQRGNLDVAGRIRAALGDEGFELHAQRISALQAEEMPYFEVLLRMNDGGEPVSPGVFIPVAERYRLMDQLDAFVARTAIRLLGEHLAAGGAPLRLAINISGQSFASIELATAIVQWLQDFGVESQCLCVEITETAAISDLTNALAFLNVLRTAGCRIALDDFGSGMSSFGYLRDLPVDVVKIDGAFVSRMLDNEVDRTFVQVIHQLAKAMRLKTVAEFVEDAATLAMLCNIGVDYAQGYHIDRPSPLAAQLASERERLDDSLPAAAQLASA